MPLFRILCCVSVAVLASPALAQTPVTQEQKPTMEELIRRIDALQRRTAEGDKLISALRHRVDELETNQRHTKSQTTTASREAAAPAERQVPRITTVVATEPPLNANAAVPVVQPAAGPIPGLLPPEKMGSRFDGQGEDPLRSDLPGLSLRIPGTQSEVRFYGLVNLTAFRDFNARNQTDDPAQQSIPLALSPAALQGGDFGLSARFSRIGMDTRTAIAWGTLETRIEGDFAGGSPALSSPYLFRLRQAWGEFGTEQFRVLVGQANSLWNEDVYETVNFATNLNQSFVRQPQIRATATLAPGWTGQVSLEMPNTQYTSVAGVFTTTGTPGGFSGLSPAFTLAPDLLGRLEYSNDGMVVAAKGLLRDLSVHTAGTAAAPPALTTNAAGWGVAGDALFPMRWVSGAFGADELSGIVYYGRGIGRYFDSNTVGQDAMSNIGLPGVINFSLDPLPTYGASIAYRRFWMPELRSNFVYSYAWHQYPSYALPLRNFFFQPTNCTLAKLNWARKLAAPNGILDRGPL